MSQKTRQTPGEGDLPSSGPAEKKCSICFVPRTEHERLVRAGELHHRFSEQGELVHDAPRKPQVRATPDLALRMALIDAGVVKYSDIARAEAQLGAVSPAGGRESGADRADRPAP